MNVRYIVVFVVIFGTMVWLALPPNHLTIYTAPAGAQYDAAIRYKPLFARRGVTIDIVKVDDITNLSKHVGRADTPPSVSFVGTTLSEDTTPNIRTAGMVELLPMFILYNTRLESVASPRRLQGHTICLPPRPSITSRMAVVILALFEVTEQNSRIEFLPLASVGQRLKEGTCDSAVIVLGVGSPMLADLARQSFLRFADFRDLPTLKKRIENVDQVVIPRGSFDMNGSVPAADLVTIAIPNTVVFREDLHPELLLMLLDIMRTSHRPATMLARPGEFPQPSPQNLPVNEVVNSFYAQGLPWPSRNLPYPVAAIVNTYLNYILALFTLVQVAALYTLFDKGRAHLYRLFARFLPKPRNGS